MTLTDSVQIPSLDDQSTPADQSLPSCLVAAGDPDMITAYRQIAGPLALDIPASDDHLHDIAEADMHQVHHHSSQH
ncbi:hypothetical protein ABZ341_37290 [Streptomyces sp. NPDC006173]|uniref:hypothetical protein n=1 Tax=Streptomyces sp. NPDC006173 TaxID=3155349 RepID=UPI0033DCE8FF